MTRNWKKTGYLIPQNIEPDENICVCVPIPKDWGHINAFMGQLSELSKWLTWEKTGGDEALRAARRWLEIFGCVTDEVNRQMSGNCGCGGGGSDTPQEQRIDEDGFVTVSPDGGGSWVIDTANDPRFTGTTLPVPEGAPSDTKKCQMANSVVAALKEKQAADLAQRELGADFTAFVNGITGFLISLGVITGGVTIAITVIAGLIFQAIANVLAADFESAFTDEVWSAVLCAVYCNIGDDGSFTTTQYVQTSGDARTAISNNTARSWVYNTIHLMGTIGLTNAARQMRAGSMTCDLCDCSNGCPVLWDIYNDDPYYGTILERGDDYLLCELTSSPYLTLITGAPDECCFVGSIEVISGEATGTAHENCDSDQTPPWINTTPVNECCNVMEIQGTVGSVVKIILAPCGV